MLAKSMLLSVSQQEDRPTGSGSPGRILAGAVRWLIRCGILLLRRQDGPFCSDYELS